MEESIPIETIEAALQGPLIKLVWSSEGYL